MASQPTVLTMGFSPAAAVATWRLASSRMFQCFTYWPIDSVLFDSEVFGQQQEYRPTHFDLGNAAEIQKLPGRAFSVVILIVPTIKDVVRMCRRVQSVVNKNTLVLVDVSGGIAPLQRIVRTNLEASQVGGIICDLDAEFETKSGGKWTIVHRKSSKKASLTIEPTQSKILSALETAWSATGLAAAHPKSAAVFGELQWQNTIAVVAFELLTVALDIPEPEKLGASLIAKPIIDGLVSELCMVAHASGIKSLPSKSKMVARGIELARRAPASFSVRGASRSYYDVYRRTSIALDFLVLLPILLSDELPKGGPTPYLESLYAYMSRLLDLNNNTYQSELFQRKDQVSVDPTVLAQLNQRSEAVLAKETEMRAREQRCNEVLEEIRVQKEQHASRAADLESQTAQHQRRLQSFEELNERSDKLRLREEQFSEMERKLTQKDRGLRQREMDIVNREQAMLSREPMYMNGGGAAMAVDPVVPGQQSPPEPPQPTTPGGTTYSRFDPRAPRTNPPPPAAMTPQMAPGPQQQFYAGQNRSRASQVPMNGMMYAGPVMNGHTPMMNGGAPMMNGGVPVVNGVGPMPTSSSSASIHSAYSPDGRPMSRVPYGAPVGQQGMYAPQAAPGQRRRAPRRMSTDDAGDLGPTYRRRQQSMPVNSTLFSQNFQLDGVIGSATDRYHFVSRGRNKPGARDPKLSSDEAAYTQGRKFVHGGPASTGTMPSRVSSSHNISVDLGGSAYPDSASRSFNPGDLSSNSLGNASQRKSVGAINKMLSSGSRSMLPTRPSEFGGFAFGDQLDDHANSNGSSGSNNVSSSGSNGTPNRSRTGTPPTPHGTMDPAAAMMPGQKWENNNMLPLHLS